MMIVTRQTKVSGAGRRREIGPSEGMGSSTSLRHRQCGGWLHLYSQGPKNVNPKTP